MRDEPAQASPAPDPPQFRFGDVVVDTHARAVTRNGQPVALEPKSYAVLLALLRRPGELLTHDALLDEVWGHRHVTPGVLTRAIAQLRHALGDDPHEPRYIRTRHAIGYCFIGQLLADEPDAPAQRARHERPVDLEAGAVGAGDAAADDAAPGRRPAAARWWMPIALAAAVGIAALLVWTLFQRQAQAVEPSIAVLPFASVGAADGDRYFAEGLAIEMHGALAAVPGLEVVAVRGLESSDRDARRLGRRLGVAHVLDASVRREGQRVRISAWLTDTRTGVTRWSGRFDREAASVFAVQGEVAAEVVHALKGVVPAPAVSRRLQPTTDFGAYDAYLHGLQALSHGGGEQHLAAAVGYFERALQRDPSFARARAGLCRAELARFEDRLDAVAFSRADRACMQAAASDPQLREVDLALGDLYRVRGDHRRAIGHYTRALDDLALRARAHVGLARANAGLRRPADARRHFADALRLQPNDANVHREHGYQQYLDGDLAGAIGSYRRATQLAPGDERLWSSLGGLLLASGDGAGARAAFQRSLAIRPNYAALSNYGSLRYEARDYAEAEALYRRAAGMDASDFRLWGNLGDATAAQAGQATRARPAYERAARLAQDYAGIRPDDAQALALLAWYRANLGDAEAARDALARAEVLGTEAGEVAFLGAQVHALLGDAASARERIPRATANGIARPRLAASPTLRPLLPAQSAAP